METSAPVSVSVSGDEESGESEEEEDGIELLVSGKSLEEVYTKIGVIMYVFVVLCCSVL